MIRYISILCSIFIIISCATKKSLVINEKSANPVDSVEYEIIVSESGFQQWFVTNRKPIWFYSHDYYMYYNQLYTSEWNNRFYSSNFHYPYEYMIEYDRNTNYGLELDYKLYWFYKYVQQRYNIKLHITERR